MSELKPCPFCGGEATLRYEPSPGVYYVHCDTCGSETGNTGLYRKEDKAIDAWNTRNKEAVNCIDCTWFRNTSDHCGYCNYFDRELGDDYDGGCLWGIPSGYPLPRVVE